MVRRSTARRRENSYGPGSILTSHLTPCPMCRKLPRDTGTRAIVSFPDSSLVGTCTLCLWLWWIEDQARSLPTRPEILESVGRGHDRLASGRSADLGPTVRQLDPAGRRTHG
jgi:hypothetical protein